MCFVVVAHVFAEAGISKHSPQVCLHYFILSYFGAAPGMNHGVGILQHTLAIYSNQHAYASFPVADARCLSVLSLSQHQILLSLLFLLFLRLFLVLLPFRLLFWLRVVVIVIMRVVVIVTMVIISSSVYIFAITISFVTMIIIALSSSFLPLVFLFVTK